MKVSDFFKKIISSVKKKKSPPEEQAKTGFTNPSEYQDFKSKFLPYVAVVTIMAGLGVTLFQIQYDQDPRSRATQISPTPTMIPTNSIENIQHDMSTQPLATGDYSEQELVDSTSKIQTLMAPFVSDSKNFELTPEITGLLATRRLQMYYFAQKNPDLFMQNVLSTEIRALLPVQLIEETDMGVQGVYTLAGDKSGTVVSHDTNESVYIFSTNSLSIQIPNTSKVFIVGTKIHDRIVVSSNKDITKLDTYMEGH